MNLLQLCEPVFLYICRINRIYRNGGTVPMATIQADIADLREGIQAALIQEDRSLNDAFEQIELSLIYFIDSMLVSAGVEEWNSNRIAVKDFNRRAGDNEFFDFLAEAEADRAGQARLMKSWLSTIVVSALDIPACTTITSTSCTRS